MDRELSNLFSHNLIYQWGRPRTHHPIPTLAMGRSPIMTQRAYYYYPIALLRFKHEVGRPTLDCAHQRLLLGCASSASSEVLILAQLLWRQWWSKATAVLIARIANQRSSNHAAHCSRRLANIEWRDPSCWSCTPDRLMIRMVHGLRRAALRVRHQAISPTSSVAAHRLLFILQALPRSDILENYGN